MKKLLGILLTLTLALSCLSLSASAEEAQLSGSITFLSGETDEEQVTVTRALIEAFEKENPGCTINLVLAGMDDREESIMADLYAGAPVDLITVDCESIGTYANAGILYPLDELIERIGEDDFIPGSRVQIDGHDYGFPYAGCSMQMFIRTDLLEEAGVENVDETRLQGDHESFMVTPRDIDAQVRDLSKVVGYALNWALQGLDVDEIDALLS